MGLDSGDQYFVQVDDAAGVEISTNTGVSNKDDAHIGILKKRDKTVYLEYYDASTSHTSSDSQILFASDNEFNTAVFRVGRYDTNYLDGELNELIIFNRALTDIEIADVKGYLNYKYKIY